MNSIKHIAAAALLAVAVLAPLAASAQTVKPLTVGGGWVEFDVDELLAPQGQGGTWIDLDGTPLSFSFTLSESAELRVVDAGFAGDRFAVFVPTLGQNGTSIVPQTDVEAAANIGLDFDAAWADGGVNFSRLSLVLGPGEYTVSGQLLQSALLGGQPLNATVGAIALAPVPEPASVATLLTGLLLIASVLRGRNQRGD